MRVPSGGRRVGPEIWSGPGGLGVETARGIVSTGAQTSLGYVLGLLYYVAATRVLTKEEIGVIVMLGVYSFLFAKIFTLSLNSGIAKLAAEARERGEDLGPVLGSYLAVTLLLSAAAGVSAAAAIWLGGERFVGAPVGPLEAAAAAAIAAGNVWVYNSFGYLSGSGDYGGASRVMGGYPAINSLARMAGLPMGVPGVVLGMAAAAAGMGSYGLASSLRGARPAGLDRGLILRMVSFSIPLHGRVLLNYARANVIDKVLVQWLAGPGALGVYSVAETLTHFLVGLSNVVSSITFPGLVRVREGAGGRSVGRGIGRVFRYVLLLYLPVCAMLAALAGPLIGIVTTRDYSAAAPVMATFAASYSMLPLVETTFAGLMAFDMTWAVLGIQSIQVMVEGAAVAVMVPALGLAGGAAAQGVSLGLGLALGLAALGGRTDVPVRARTMAHSVLLSAAAAVPAACASAALDPVASLIIGALAGSLTYAALSRLLGALTEEDSGILRGALPKRLWWILEILGVPNVTGGRPRSPRRRPRLRG